MLGNVCPNLSLKYTLDISEESPNCFENLLDTMAKLPILLSFKKSKIRSANASHSSKIFVSFR